MDAYVYIAHIWISPIQDGWLVINIQMPPVCRSIYELTTKASWAVSELLQNIVIFCCIKDKQLLE